MTRGLIVLSEIDDASTGVSELAKQNTVGRDDNERLRSVVQTSCQDHGVGFAEPNTVCPAPHFDKKIPQVIDLYQLCNHSTLP